MHHIANPGVPCCILKTVAEAGKDKDNGNDRIRRVTGNGDVCNKLGEWRGDGNTELAESHMNLVVKNCGCRVASKWGKKHECYSMLVSQSEPGDMILTDYSI